MAATTIQTSILLGLPAELRNDIFSYALADSKLDVDRQYHNGGDHLPGLTLACKQTLLETRTMYYKNVSVISNDRWIIGKWVARLATLSYSHPHRLIRTIYLDCRNRSEQLLPLRLGQRFALSHHSGLKLEGLKKRIEILNESLEEPLTVMACVVTPNQEVVWTEHPFALNEMLWRHWNGRSSARHCRLRVWLIENTGLPEKRRALSMEEWAPSGTEGLFWHRERI